MPVTSNILDVDTRKKLDLVYPDYKVRLIRTYNDFYNRHKKRLRLTEGLRDFATQAKLYAQGRTTPGKIVTHALPGQSIHHYGSAGDSCFISGDPYLEQLEQQNPKQAEFYWNEFGRFAKGNGLVWGGDWPSNKLDRPHTQITYGLTLEQIQELYHYGGLRAVWAKFDQIRGVEIASEWGQMKNLDPKPTTT